MFLGIPGPLQAPRRWGLGSVSVVYFSRGLAYSGTAIPEPLPLGLNTISELVPIWVYGILWIAAGIDCLWVAHKRKAPLAVAFMTGMPTLWGSAYLISWVASGFDSRDWITVILYYCLAMIAVCFGVIPPKEVKRDAARRGSE